MIPIKTLTNIIHNDTNQTLTNIIHNDTNKL